MNDGDWIAAIFGLLMVLIMGGGMLAIALLNGVN